MSAHPRLLAALVTAALSAASLAQESEPVFSGPQAGEKLADFKVLDVLANEGQAFQFSDKVGDSPVVLVFVHKATRPSIGLTRTVLNEAERLKKKGLKSALIFLSDDVTAMQEQVKRMSRALPKDSILGISPDKLEGPGAYGLNRNMTLTVLVGKAGKVSANFAIVQPSIQADSLKIITAAYKAAGEKNPPSIGELLLRPLQNKELREPLIALMDLKAKDRDVAKLVKQIDDYIGKTPRAKQQLTQNAGRLLMAAQDDKYEEGVRKALQRWGRRNRGPARPRMSDKLSGLIRAVIRGTSDEEVTKANEALEAHLAENKADQTEVGRIATTITNSDKLGNYGTPKAQEFIKAWAKKYGKKNDARRR